MDQMMGQQAGRLAPDRRALPAAPPDGRPRVVGIPRYPGSRRPSCQLMISTWVFTTMMPPTVVLAVRGHRSTNRGCRVRPIGRSTRDRCDSMAAPAPAGRDRRIARAFAARRRAVPRSGQRRIATAAKLGFLCPRRRLVRMGIAVLQCNSMIGGVQRLRERDCRPAPVSPREPAAAGWPAAVAARSSKRCSAGVAVTASSSRHQRVARCPARLPAVEFALEIDPIRHGRSPPSIDRRGRPTRASAAR